MLARFAQVRSCRRDGGVGIRAPDVDYTVESMRQDTWPKLQGFEDVQQVSLEVIYRLKIESELNGAVRM